MSAHTISCFSVFLVVQFFFLIVQSCVRWSIFWAICISTVYLMPNIYEMSLMLHTERAHINEYARTCVCVRLPACLRAITVLYFGFLRSSLVGWHISTHMSILSASSWVSASVTVVAATSDGVRCWLFLSPSSSLAAAVAAAAVNGCCHHWHHLLDIFNNNNNNKNLIFLVWIAMRERTWYFLFFVFLVLLFSLNLAFNRAKITAYVCFYWAKKK